MSKEKKRPKNLQRLDDYNTLRRETKGFQPKKFPPPEFSVKDNLTYAAKQGVKKAKEVGKKVVDKATDMGSKAKKALETLQNPTKAKKALEEARKEREGKAYGGKVKKMAQGGRAGVDYNPSKPSGGDKSLINEGMFSKIKRKIKNISREPFAIP